MMPGRLSTGRPLWTSRRAAAPAQAGRRDKGKLSWRLSFLLILALSLALWAGIWEGAAALLQSW